MNNNKIKQALQKIEPDNQAKERMLEQILCRKHIETRKDIKVSSMNNIIKWVIPAAACLVIAITAVLASELFTDYGTIDIDKGKEGSMSIDVSQKSGTEDSSTEDKDRPIVPWNQRHVTQQFYTIKFGGAEYITTSPKAIAAADIQAQLGEITVTGYDRSEKTSTTEYNINCEVYSVKNISSNAVIAVKFNGHGGYFPFVSTTYSPITLEDFVNDMNLQENLKFGKIYDNSEKGQDGTIAYTLEDQSVLWDMLFSDTSIKAQTNIPYSDMLMSISVAVDIIGIEDDQFLLNQDGYLRTNLVASSRGISFFIGKDKSSEIIEYVRQNATQTKELW
ncbi:MAG: hypothetical protein FWH14_02850 [Oscillospiraceae bacterium]|nr:hypothetical protein [Oscillospiraceae bacterium]